MEQIFNRLSEDVKKEAISLSNREARFLVTNYYAVQDYRKAMTEQINAYEKGNNQPLSFLKWTEDNMRKVENEIKKLLRNFAATRPEGVWAMSNIGVDGVLAAGLIATIDIEIADTAGAVWNLAGWGNQEKVWLGKTEATKICKAHELKPDSTKEVKARDVSEFIDDISGRIGIPSDRLIHWAITIDDFNGNKDESNKKLTIKNLVRAASLRPWNPHFRTLCWKIGHSFMMVMSKEDAFYGDIYANRKKYEEKKNDHGDYKDQAKVRAGQVGRSTVAYSHYSRGNLPPAHITSRCQRYASKMFLSHFHFVSYVVNKGELPPKPFVIEHGGHAHMIEPPNLEVIQKYYDKAKKKATSTTRKTVEVATA